MNGKNITILLLVLVLIFIAYLIFSKKTNVETNSDGSITAFPTTASTIIGNVTNVIDGSFPLKKGSVGKNVTILQEYLNSKGAALSTDGVFGNLTQAALLKYTGLSEIDANYFNTYIVTNTSAPSVLVGKTARAGNSGCKVYSTDYKTYFTLFKNASSGEWLGVVKGVNNAKQYYELGGDKVAPMDCVSLRNE